MKKRRLGKGLASLIGMPDLSDASDLSDDAEPQQPAAPPTPAPDAPKAEAPATEPLEIELSRIDLNPRQPRQVMDREALESLAESIRSAGVLQPIVVRRKGDMYELVMGERRLRACLIAGRDSIPAVVRDIGDEHMLEFALIENVQREDLNPIEKAQAIRRLTEELAITQEQVADKLGLKRPTIANFLRLLDLPQEIQDMVSRGTISAGHARAVLMIQNQAEQVLLAQRIAAEGLSVRQAEKLAAKGISPRVKPEPVVSAQVQRLRGALQESLATKVEILTRGKAGTRGRIIIHFADNEQFERLFELMTGTADAAKAPEEAAA